MLHNSTRAPTHSAESYDSMDCAIYDLEAVLARLRSSFVCRQFRGSKIICPAAGYCAASIDSFRRGLDFNGALWQQEEEEAHQ